MKNAARICHPTLLLVLLLLPAVTVGAAHMITQPTHDDHCVLCLLYGSMAIIAVATATWRFRHLSGRLRLCPADMIAGSAERALPLSRSPPTP